MPDIRGTLLRTWRGVTRVGPLLVLVSAAATYWSAERARGDTSDNDLAVAADRVARTVDVYLARAINDLAMITNLRDIRQEAADYSARPRSKEYEQALDDEWRLRMGDKRLEGEIDRILETESSKYLGSIVRLDGMLTRELAIADVQGRLIAASVRTDDYLQGDDKEWWPEDPPGFLNCKQVVVECAQFPRALRWDETARAWGMDVVLPLFSPDKPRDREKGLEPKTTVVGFLKAVIDPINELAPLTANPLAVRLVKKDDAKPLLARDEPPVLSKEEAAKLKELDRGGQAFFRTPGTTRVVVVRALWGPLGKHWAVAASRNNVEEAAAWVVPTFWLALTVAALFVATSSRPVQAATADAAPAPVETV
jgi:hypothetical protein